MKNLIQKIIISTMAFLMVFVGMLNPIDTHAQTVYVSDNVTETWNFTLVDDIFPSRTIVGQPIHYQAQGSDTKLFCLNIGEIFDTSYRTKTTMQEYFGISDAKAHEIAIANYYIQEELTQYTESERNKINQIYLWDDQRHLAIAEMGPGGYQDGLAYVDYGINWTWSGLGFIDDAELKRIFAQANQFAKDNVNNFITSNEVYPGPNTQQTVGGTTAKLIEKYDVSLVKSNTSDKALTDLAPNSYSLEGAQYGVYSDSGLTKQVGTLTTDSQGNTNGLTLNKGTYYVKEIKAPKGYELDATVYTADLTSGDVIIQSKDAPKFYEFDILLQKKGNKPGPSLEGAQFEVNYYDSSSLDSPIKSWVFKTDKNGVIKYTPEYLFSGDQLFKTQDNKYVGLIGTYTFKEIKAPYGYVLDDTLIEKTITDKTPLVYQTVMAENEVVMGNITLTKKDAETGQLLANAKYQLLDTNKEVLGEYTTNEKGTFTTQDIELGTYYLLETEAPEGFILDKQPKEVNVNYHNQNTPLVEVHSEQVNKPIRGQIQIVKVNAQDEEVPVPNAKFEVYQLPNREVVDTLTTDENGFATTKSLRYGNYVIKEVEAPQEFYLNDNEYPISIRVHDKTEVQYIKNDEVNVKLKVLKTDNETIEPIENVHFEVRNKETGELVTFEYLDDSYQIVTQNELITNSKGEAYTRGYLKYGTYILEETKAAPGYIKGEPIEFTIDRDTDTVDLAVIGRTSIEPVTNEKTTTEISKVDIAGNEIVGAEMRLIETESKNVMGEWVSSETPFVVRGLEFNKSYTLIEDLAPVGYELSNDIEFTIDEDGVTQIQMIDEKTIELKTTAAFEDGNKESLPKEKLVIVDVVEANNLWVGKEYTLEGQLVDLETEEVVATGSTTFVAEASEQTINVLFEIEANDLLGKELVVFEDIYREGRKLGSHAELTDKNQTVYIPEIKTTATDLEGNKEVLPLEEVTIVDVVDYTALEEGTTYTLKGELVRKDTRDVIATAETSFVAENHSGKVELEFTFNASELQGQDVVVFERVYRDDVEVAVHVDFEAESQTVKVLDPSLMTTATESIGLKEVLPLEKVIIVDKVEYTNLVPGKEYTLKGQLIRKSDESVLSENNLTFIPETDTGCVELIFNVDSSTLKGEEVVVFEELYYENQLIGEHKDINDEGQTVSVVNPSLKTMASTSNRNPQNPTFVTLLDEVYFEQLIPGKEYTIKGTLMDKSTEQPFKVNNETVEITHTFTPRLTTGYEILEFTFDQRGLEPGVLVVFEELFFEGQMIASHADLQDTNQSINVSSLSITKVDHLTQRPLEGAEFSVYQDNVLIESKMTDKNGQLFFTLEEGRYEVKETKAPIGYKASTNSYPLVIDFETEPYLEWTISNKEIELPTTGFNATIYSIVGLSVIGLGLTWILRKKKAR